MLPKPKLIKLPNAIGIGVKYSELSGCAAYRTCDSDYICTPYGNQCIDSSYDNCKQFEVGVTILSATTGAVVGIIVT